MAKQIKGRKFFAASATAALVASAIVPAASAASVNDFNQVPSWAKDAVQYLVDNGSVQGDQNGNFKPFNNLSRAQAAEIISKELGLSANGSENYSDVSEGQWFYNAVVATSNAGIFEGNEKGQFLPNKELTRQEAAKVIVEAFGLTGTQNLGAFPDANKVPGWAKAYFETAVANGVINGKGNVLAPTDKITNAEFATMIKRAVDASGVAGTVTAVNNTTVEVAFTEDIEDIKALDFAIEGLEVKNAVVKQTDASVAVLTTSAQEGGKQYTVTLNGENIGSFVGVSAVIPTKVTTTTSSLQGVIGKEVTLKAEVEVASGQSKAGIPVTFNIQHDDKIDNQTVEVEVTTDENGVAQYSYTRYYKGIDDVTAYATQKSSVNDESKVYWYTTEQLTVKADTKDTKFKKGESVEYEVKLDSYKELYKDVNYVLVTFEENIDVESDEVEDDIYITDAYGFSEDEAKSVKLGEVKNKNGYFGINDHKDLEEELVKDSDLKDDDIYPFQTKTDSQIIVVDLDDKGEGSFTVTGGPGKVTPIVYVPSGDNSAGKWTRTDLQVAADAVEFEESQSMKIEIDSKGVQNAAATAESLIEELKKAEVQKDKNYELKGVEIKSDKDNNYGGRDYVATLKDEDGDTVGKNTEVFVVIEDGKVSDKNDVFLIDNNTNKVHAVIEDKAIELRTDSKGKVDFTLVGEKGGYATPTVFYDNGSDKKDGELDSKDLQATADKVYFKSPEIKTAVLEVKDTDGDKVTSVVAKEEVDYIYYSVDQNEKPYYNVDKKGDIDEFEATYQVSAKLTNVTVYKKDVENGTLEKLGDVAAGKTVSFDVDSKKGKTIITVVGNQKGSASVKVSSTSPKLSTISKDVKFLDTTQVGSTYTNWVFSIDTAANKLTFFNTDRRNAKEAVKYETKDTFIDDKGNSITLSTFETLVERYLGQNKNVTVKYEEGEKEDTWTIVEIENTTPSGNTQDQAAADKVTDKVDAIPALSSLALTDEATVEAARTAYNALTADQKALVTKATLDKLVAAEAKIAELKGEETEATIEITTATAQGFNALSNMLGSYDYTVEGTVGAELAGETVTLTFTGETEKTETVTVDAEGNFKFEIGYDKFFGTFNKVTAKVSTVTAEKAIDVTEAQ